MVELAAVLVVGFFAFKLFDALSRYGTERRLSARLSALQRTLNETSDQGQRQVIEEQIDGVERLLAKIES